MAQDTTRYVSFSQSQDLADQQCAHLTSMSTIRPLLTYSREWELQKYGK
jgi:hypothetical protein